jgi:hypothetical protein
MIKDLFKKEDWNNIKKIIGVEIDENTPTDTKISYYSRGGRRPYIWKEYRWEMEISQELYEKLKNIYDENIVYKHYKLIGAKRYVLIRIDFKERKIVFSFYGKEE